VRRGGNIILSQMHLFNNTLNGSKKRFIITDNSRLEKAVYIVALNNYIKYRLMTLYNEVLKAGSFLGI